jgi:hypothetical protein
MLNIALGDIGMFFFDEENNFIYESAWAYYNSIYPQHSNVQWTLDEDINIVSGSLLVELLVNKVTVKVYPIKSYSSSTQEIWSANSNESLAAATLINSLNSNDSGSDAFIEYATTTNEAGEIVPVFKDSGFIRMGDEIIKYEIKDGYKLSNLTRGMFNTRVASYGSGEFIGEAREYTMEWSGGPILSVKYPFLTAVIFDGTVDVNLWSSDSIGGHLVISLNSLFDEANFYQVLQGNNPVSGLDNAFVVAGIPVAQSESTESITEKSSSYQDKIRKHQVKSITIDNPYIQDAAYAQRIADFVLSHNDTPVKIVNMATVGLPHLQLGDRIDIGQFTMLSISGIEYWVIGADIQYDGGIQQTLTLKQVT